MSHPYAPPPASAGLRWSGWTDRGPFRPNNEDAFLGVCFDAREVQHLGKFGQAPSCDMDFAFAVSDGMGGAKAGVAEFVFVGRVVEQFECFLVRRFLVGCATYKVHALECGRIREEETVVEGKLGINPVIQRDVGQLMRQNHCQRSFIR